MANFFSEAELRELTEAFQVEYSPDRAEQILAGVVRAMVSEPGDRMAGALARLLGPIKFLRALVEDLPVEELLEELSLAELYELELSCGDVRATLEDSRQRWLPRMRRQNIILALARCRQLGLGLLLPGDPLFPSGLNDLQDFAPAMLFVEGRAEVLADLDDSISIVGSRRATSYGIAVTRAVVSEFAKTGKVTVSGGAIGIDGECHSASLLNNLTTIAVMAGGLDRKYPTANFPLFENIMARGAVISELPPGVAPSRWRFLQRNRIIAALTPRTVVIEAGSRSGSIRTANNALELDRELFAVPGSILSQASLGTNDLINQGKARMLLHPNQLGEKGGLQPRFASESELATRALDALLDLGTAPKSAIAENAGLTRSELLIALKELTEQRKIIEVPIGQGSSHYALNHGE